MGLPVKEGVIYLVTNRVSGKRYVGKTVAPLSRRWRQHQRDARIGSKCPLHGAIRKYGADLFSIEVIAESLAPFLNALEQTFIRLYSTQDSNFGYNATAGGDGASSGEANHRFGKKLSAETRRKISEAHKGKKLSPEHAAAIRKANYGRIPWNLGLKHSAEACAKMSASRTGEKNHFFGRKHSAQTIQRISIANTGRQPSREARSRMSLAQTGRKHTAASIEKMRTPKSEATRQRMRVAQQHRKEERLVKKAA